MGIHNNALIGGSGQGGYFINNSVRLRSSASAYLNRTHATTTSRTIWTVSFWVKRGILGSGKTLIGGSNSATNNGTGWGARFQAGNTLQISAGGGVRMNLVGGIAYRDPSAWYHIVFSVDTTQATAANRFRVYVNSVEQTTWTSNSQIAQNEPLEWNSSSAAQYIGTENDAGVVPTTPFDGYYAEFHSVDGQQLTPSSFGETDTLTGQWVAKKYTGTYGTNGFYLKFADTSDNTAATIGKDSSGNGNNWTPNAISKTAGVTYDFMTDSPTVGPLASNYAVLNPLDYYSDPTISAGNLQIATTGSGSAGAVKGTIGVSSGKWYWEATQTAGSARGSVGILSSATRITDFLGNLSTGYIYNGIAGNKYNNGTNSAYGASFTNGDVIGVALDMDAGTLTFYKNNSSQGTAYTGLSGTFSPAFSDTGGASGIYAVTFAVNFGQRPFAYTPPTGYSALNTYNLPAPAIKNGALNMTAALWTANVASPTTGQKSIALGFQPDLVWSKNRSDAEHHYWVDSVRGDNSGSKWLKSNSTAVEGADAVGSTTAKYVFSSTGFDIIDTDSTAGEVYYTNRTYVGWAWKAGGTAVTNTSGTISSQVSANPTAGFSIVTWTGNGVTAATVGHGLNAVPAMIICKERTGTDYWHVKHKSTTTNTNLFLNTTSASTSAASVGDGVLSDLSSSTTFGFATAGSPANVVAVNENGITNVAYCWSEIPGYSAFGSYTGNGSTDGPFVYTGFRPRFILIKASSNSTASTVWTIIDTSRNPNNASLKELYANQTAVESTDSDGIDILSNGFKPKRNSEYANFSGWTYIYAAFAENPFKYSNAR